jgi:hypothetical protein
MAKVTHGTPKAKVRSSSMRGSTGLLFAGLRHTFSVLLGSARNDTKSHLGKPPSSSASSSLKWRLLKISLLPTSAKGVVSRILEIFISNYNEGEFI